MTEPQCMGVISFGYSERFVMPLEDAQAIMLRFQNAQQYTDRHNDVPTLKPLGDYPKFNLLPLTTFKQIKVNNLLEMP